jgi:hypothetical protein
MLTGNTRTGFLKIQEECIAYVQRERQSGLPTIFASNT